MFETIQEPRVLNAVHEAKYNAVVSEFVYFFNKRLQFRINCDDKWVRIAPPNEDMLSLAQQDFRMLPFLRVGASGKITDVSKEYIMIQMSGDSLIFSREYFFCNFVRIVDPNEWKSYP
jgi:hypothetical protein